ncbi:MAG: YitT family protein [Tannerella sp.]|jgi:uncharacterized membrane-anchored protein YitT (DUF2179 family)|nr:YitT family protein [Tannerella sp.]
MKDVFSKIYHPIKDYLFIVAGTILYAFGFIGFVMPNEIVPGGLTGIASIIYYATDIPVSTSYALINVVLLALAFKMLGKKFIFNSLLGIVSLTFALMFFEWLLKDKILVSNQSFMSVVIGSAIGGAGLGMIFAAGGSTGGTDIIGAIVNKYKNISIGRALLYCDFIIIASSYLLFHDIEKIVFGYVVMFVEIFVLDRVLNANNQSVQFLIFSQKYEEIVEHIINDLGRGCTILDGKGGYSKEDVKVIVLLVKKKESAMIFRLIKSIDKQAFISQSNVQGVYGEGFDVIKN